MMSINLDSTDDDLMERSPKRQKVLNKPRTLEGLLLEFLQLTSLAGHDNKNAFSVLYDSSTTSQTLLPPGAELYGTFREDEENLPCRGDDVDNLKLQSLISQLLSYLHRSTAIPPQDGDTLGYFCTISQSDVAILLLQWALKHLSFTYPEFHSSTQKQVQSLKQERKTPDISESILWDTIATCLEILIPTATATTNRFQSLKDIKKKMETQRTIATTSHKRISALLSLSTLNKIIPLALRHSFTTCTTDTDETDIQVQHQHSASKAFTLLTSWAHYHPTIEFVLPILCDLCRFIVQNRQQISTAPMDKNHSSMQARNPSTLSLNQWTTVLSTLGLIQRLLHQGAVTHKKIFSSFLAPSILSSFAFLYQLSHPEDEEYGLFQEWTEEEKKKNCLHSIHEITQELLWIAFFHPDHHMEGFRSAPNFRVLFFADSPTKKEEDHEKRKTSHDCYQAQMFREIDSVLLQDEHKKTVSDESGQDTHMRFLSMIPLLIQGFILNSLKVEERQRRNNSFSVGNLESKNKKASEDTIKIQFIFWSRVLYPVVDYIRSQPHELNVHVPSHLKIICTGLELLSTYQMYLPNTDTGNVHFKFLSGIVTTVLKSAQRIVVEETQKDRKIHLQSLVYIVSILQALLCLNHHLLHDQLHLMIRTAVLSFNIAKRETYLDLEICSRALLVKICDTYQKLRQFNYLLSSLLPTCPSNNTSKDGLGHVRSDHMVPNISEGYLSVLQEPAFIKSLSAAVKSSPWAEIQTSWLTFDHFFHEKDLTALDVDETVANHEDVEMTVNLFIIFMRALPIDETNALLCRNSCERAIQSIVWPLLKRNSFFNLSSAVTNLMLYLFGWMIDLRTKCNFWIGDTMTDQKRELWLDESSTYDDEINPRLNATVQRMKERKCPTFAVHAIQQLACHRIQQLHAALFFHAKEDSSSALLLLASNDVSSKKRDDMMNEARELAEFIVSSSWQRQFNPNASVALKSNAMLGSWTLVMKHLSTLLPYADNIQVHTLLTWLFNCLAIGSDECNGPKDSIAVVPETDPVPRSVLVEERDAASALLCDASFFDLVPIMNNSVTAGIKVAMTLLFSGLGSQAHIVPSHHQDTRPALISVDDIHLLSLDNDFSCSEFLSVHQFACLQKHLSTMLDDRECRSVYYRVENCHLIIRSARVIEIIVDILIRDEKHFGSDAFLNYLLRLHLALHIMILSNRDHHVDSTRVLLEHLILCRKMMTLVLPYAYSLIDSSLVNQIIIYMGKTSLSSLLVSESNIHRQLVASGAECIGAFFMYCFNFAKGCPAMLKQFIEGLEIIVQSQLRSKSLETAIILIRPAISKILMISSDRIPPSCYRLLQLSVTDLIEPTSQYLRNHDLSGLNRGQILESSIFLSDVINLLVLGSDLDFVQHDIHALFLWAWDILQMTGSESREKEDDHDEVSSTIMYLFCSVSRGQLLTRDICIVDILLKIQNLMVHRYIQWGETESMLYAVYAELVNQISNEELVKVATSLCQNVALIHKRSAAFLTGAAVLHCYEYLLSLLTTADQRKALSKQTEDFVQIAISRLGLSRPCTSDPSGENGTLLHIQSLQAVSMALSTIAKFKGSLYMLKSSEIAEILSKTGMLLADAHISSLRNDQRLIVFNICCDLTHSLLKQYPKRLYGCSPCLIATIRTLLKSLLDQCASDGMMEHMADDALHKFSKLCETLVQHKSIFKKHVVGLILDFIDGVDGMDPILKSKFSPSLYFLLDTLSSHENKQLNVLMTEREKNIFRTLYQHYQKDHLYQGQF